MRRLDRLSRSHCQSSGLQLKTSAHASAWRCSRSTNDLNNRMRCDRVCGLQSLNDRAQTIQSVGQHRDASEIASGGHSLDANTHPTHVIAIASDAYGGW